LLSLGIGGRVGAERQDGVHFVFSIHKQIHFGHSSIHRVYGVLRAELWGEALKKFQGISYVHSRETSRAAKAKI
jgi:hypothetical protein